MNPLLLICSLRFCYIKDKSIQHLKNNTIFNIVVSIEVKKITIVEKYCVPILPQLPLILTSKHNLRYNVYLKKCLININDKLLRFSSSD